MKHRKNFAILFILAILITLTLLLFDQNWQFSNSMNLLKDFGIIASGISLIFGTFYVLYWALFMTYRKE
ncbi:MAG: hypothetical protein AAF487_07535 [Bacteroidota bacterium]